jgi:predicted ATPase/DNA-binding winged helix-turn-helix (wHTH) protein
MQRSRITPRRFDMPLTYRFAPYLLQPDRRLLAGVDGPLKLGGRAFDLLLALVERRDRTVSHDELMTLVWPHLVVEENNLQVQVMTLRKLLGHAAIATVPGRGYRFTLPVDVDGAESPASSIAGPVPTAPARRPIGNLPLWLPPLHGRDETLAALQQLQEARAWITLVGPAGIGKTRLAQAAAQRRADAFPGGAWWVDLALLTDVQQVVSAIAVALGLRCDAAPDLVPALGDRLAAAPTLLVLDNAEHLAAGLAGLLARLMQRAGALQLLLTSQEPVHAPGEQLFRVGPLALPADDTPEAVAASGAVQLFVARVQSADRHFALLPAHHVAVADICRRLDGIPLAIELAAAQLPLLGLRGLRTRLDQRLRLLTAADRTAAQRHRTLREAVEWSHQLLTPAEQAVFRRLGVFVGGFTLAAAQAVAADDDGIDAWDLLEHLGRLVDKSLVAAAGDDLPRYRLLETLRLLALEKLIESGEADRVRSAHRAHFAELAIEANAALNEGKPGVMALLDAERDNLSLAMSWSLDDPTGEQGLRLAEALAEYFPARGLLALGLDRMRAALERAPLPQATALRCRVELCAAGACSVMGLQDEAMKHALRALRAGETLADDACRSHAHALLAQICELEGDLQAAQQHAASGLQVARSLGEPRTLRRALMVQASVSGRLGQPDAALGLEQEALALCRSTGLPRMQAEHLLNIAWMHCEAGRVGQAKAALCEAAALEPRVDSEYFSAGLLRTVSAWASLTGRHEMALRCHAAHAAQCLRNGVDAALEAWEQQCHSRSAHAVDADACARADREGRNWSRDEAMHAVSALLAALDGEG